MMSTTRHMIKRPITFLCLAPVHSDSFPKAPVAPIVKAPVESTLTQTLTKPVDAIITAPVVPSISRRHSSTSSVGSQRFLKLGPVHWGDSKGEEDYTFEK